MVYLCDMGVDLTWTSSDAAVGRCSVGWYACLYVGVDLCMYKCTLVFINICM